MQVHHDQLVELIKAYVPAQIVPMITGSPGIGKSAVVHQVAKEYNLKVIDLRLAQCDPTDIGGFPTFNNGRATYAPMDTFPIEEDEIPEGYSGWLLFLDEMNSSSRAVQAASYKLVLDRMVGQHKLHSKVAIVCAGNLETDNAIVEELSTALQSRMAHVELSLNHETWCDWAMSNGFDHRITDFIKFKPNALYTFKPDHTDNTYACPRTWEFLNRLMVNVDIQSPIFKPLAAGVISEGVAFEFITFTKIYQSLPTIESILASPTTTSVPSEPSVLYAITGALSNHVKEETLDVLVKYIERLPSEFQVLTVKEIVHRNTEMINKPSIQKWTEKIADMLIA